MGHFKMRLVPQGTIPRDAKLGVRMRRLQPGETASGRGRRTFGPPVDECVAEFGAWSVTTVPNPIVPGEPFEYHVWPTEDSVLCEGDCLEWALSMEGPGGEEPSATITAAEDCVGVVLTIDDTEEAIAGWVFTLTATLDGQPYGPPLGFTPVEDCTFVADHWEGDPDFGAEGELTYPQFLSEPIVRYFRLYADTSFAGHIGDCPPTLELLGFSLGAAWPSSTAPTVTLLAIIASPGADFVTLQMQIEYPGFESDDLSGTELNFYWTYDGGAVAIPDLVIYCEV